MVWYDCFCDVNGRDSSFVPVGRREGREKACFRGDGLPVSASGGIWDGGEGEETRS